MRRSEKEITDIRDIHAILEKAQVLRLAMARDNEPYLVPLSYGWDGKVLYFHCATEGEKLDILKANPRVCFEVELGVELVTHETKPCAWGFHFQTVIGRGQALELADMAEKRTALALIMAHYSNRDWSFPDAALDASVTRTSVWKIEIDSLTGKRG